MDKKQIKLHAEAAINSIIDYIEKFSESTEEDIEINDNNVIIEFNTINVKCVVNFHNATDQIWLASSVSGAHRFEYKEKAGKWVAKNNKELLEMVKEELVR